MSGSRSYRLGMQRLTAFLRLDVIKYDKDPETADHRSTGDTAGVDPLRSFRHLPGYSNQQQRSNLAVESRGAAAVVFAHVASTPRGHREL